MFSRALHAAVRVGCRSSHGRVTSHGTWAPRLVYPLFRRGALVPGPGVCDLCTPRPHGHCPPSGSGRPVAGESSGGGVREELETSEPRISGGMALAPPEIARHGDDGLEASRQLPGAREARAQGGCDAALSVLITPGRTGPAPALGGSVAARIQAAWRRREPVGRSVQVKTARGRGPGTRAGRRRPHDLATDTPEQMTDSRGARPEPRGPRAAWQPGRPGLKH